jgi:hypothetical protein
MRPFNNGQAVPTELLDIVKRLARLAEIYWHPDCFQKTFDQAAGSWQSALTQFLCDYSFEREGAAPAYRRFAREAVCGSGDGLAHPSPEFAAVAWQQFQAFCKQSGIGINPKLSPLNCNAVGSKTAATNFVMKLGGHNFNILTWSRTQLQAGRAEHATAELYTIRGVGRKIAAFYLRDVAKQFHLDEVACGPAWCFQPVDRWVGRVAAVWSGMLGGKLSEEDYWGGAELFSRLADSAGVRGGDLNAGVWVFASQVLDRNVADAVSTLAGLEDCLKANLCWHKAIANVLQTFQSA